jgi:hypothetical protein
MTSRTIRRTLSYFLILAALSLLAAACTRVLPGYVASLTPASSNATGTGQATARLTTGNTLTVSGSYKGLSSLVTSVQVTGSGLSFGLRADGGTSGNFKGTLPLSADGVTALNNGQLKIVIYTTNHPEGGTPELSGSLAPSS